MEQQKTPDEVKGDFETLLVWSGFFGGGIRAHWRGYERTSSLLKDVKVQAKAFKCKRRKHFSIARINLRLNVQIVILDHRL